MGWTFTEHSKRADLVAEVTKTWTDVKDCVHETVAHCWRGNGFSGTLWIVKSRTDPDGKEEKFILCYLMRYQNDRWGGGWGYKGMAESSHPYYYSCPLGYLKLAPVVCQEWRDKVRAYHAKRSKPKKLQIGDILVIDDAWQHNGTKIGEVTIHSTRPLLCTWEHSWKLLRIPRRAFVAVKRHGQVIQRRDPDTGEWKEV